MVRKKQKKKKKKQSDKLNSSQIRYSPSWGEGEDMKGKA